MLKGKQILSVALCLFAYLPSAHVCTAQFSDNFSDGEFTTNPAWTGHDSKFSGLNNQLRLTAPGVSDVAYLSTVSHAINNASWEFSVRLDFDPSGSNYTDVYLVSDVPVLNGPLNGYFVRIGNTNDEISLYRQTGITKSKIIERPGRAAGSSVQAKIKVTRDESGNWELFSQVNPAVDFISEGTGNDVAHTSSIYFGVLCIYTATRSDDFYFDDFVVSGDAYVDPSTPADFKDVIITEIFADPSPVIGLPEAEFIEIHNRSDKIINLSGWKLTDGSSTAILAGRLMQPDEYLILTPSASLVLFSTFGATMGLGNFPTLNNSSDNLTLKRNDDVTVDQVSYSDSWYRDEDKKQGGYTLELIDPANPCGEENNWIAAEAVNGGTPGTQNSVFENKPDLTGPKLLSATPLSASSLIVMVDEKLENTSPSVINFEIFPAISISNVSFSDATLKTLSITLDENLSIGEEYKLTASSIYDCSGNIIQPDFSSVKFALPEVGEEKDILINEILFNPHPAGVDFVEIYNNSSKFINLKNLSIANYESEIILNVKPITSENVLIRPGKYLVLTENAGILKGEYPLAVSDNIFVVADLPSFSDDEGTVALIDQNSTIIDFLSYMDDYHSIFIKEDEGVSLERISFTSITNEAANWKSASAASGFATPGYINSNVRGQSLDGKVKVDPEIFEPVTGQPSFTQIHYNLDQGGFVANVKILDVQGREVKLLANNTTLGTSGFLRWDGDMNDGSKARTGYYVVWMEIFNPSGEIETFRKRVVVASSFK